MKDIKPTFDNPTKSGKEIEKMFRTKIDEIDGALNEKEHSLKKKIFDLAKMETLVHNDEYLSNIYNEMAEDGEEKYGYHYNETIMNIIFNDYILNNPKYLAKYRATIPRKKKRRDKYGIKDLKKNNVTQTNDKKNKETNETTTAASSGQYATPAAWSNNSMPKMRKPIWNGGTLIGEDVDYLTNPNMFKNIMKQINEYYNIIKEHHLNTKEEKIAYIIKNKGDKYNDIEKLDSMSDEEVDNIYNKIEKEMGLVEETDNTLNEIDNQTFFNSIQKMFDKNQLGRKKSLTNTFFNEFIGKPMLGSTIIGFDSDYMTDNSFKENKVFGLEIYLENGEEIIYNVNLNTGEDVFVLPKDPKTKKQKTISRKDARTLGKIAKKVNVRSNYAMGTGDFNISDYANTNESNKVINEHHLENKDERIEFIIKNAGDKYGDKDELEKLNDESVEAIYLTLEKEMGLTENNIKEEVKFKPKAKEGDKVKLKNGDDVTMTVQRVIGYRPDDDLKIKDYLYKFKEDDSKLYSEKEIEKETVSETEENSDWEDILDEIDLNEEAKSQNQQQFMGMVYAYKKGDLKDDEVSNEVKNAAKNISLKDAKDFASTKHKDLPEKVNKKENVNEDTTKDIYVEYMSDLEGNPTFNLKGDRFKYVWAKYPDGKENVGVYSEDEDVTYNIHWFRKKFLNLNEDTMIEPLSNTMGISNDREDSMKNKSDSNIQGMNEELEKLKKDSEYLDNLFEERKLSTMIQLDRIKKENEKNFNDDVKKINDIDKAEEQYEKVGDNPKKYSENLEKEEIKKTKGQSFKNVGNSDNNKGNEIPKRNLTDDEQEEIDMIRDGMHTIAYDSKPDEKFEERMKNGMGDKLYNTRKKKMKEKENEPMYNKDPQPVYDGEKKKQFNKYSKNLGESVFTGKYKNDYGHTKFVNFKYGDVEFVDNINETFKYLNIDGIGNFYDKNVFVNESIVESIKDFDFYYNDKQNKVVMKNKIKKEISESDKEKLKKMRKLFNYNPQDFIDTTVSKSSIK